MGTANLHQEPQMGRVRKSQLEAPGSSLSHQAWSITQRGRDGVGLKGLSLTRKTGELSIPLPFSLWIHFSEDLAGSSWFHDEPHSQQVEKPARAVVNGDLCS